MALLYRFVRVPDRAHNHVFTFVVTRSVTRDFDRDVTSKEFSCGHQRWAITFSRNEKVLGVYLVWRSTSEAMRVYVDFTFTILNREHFSVNESFSGKQVKFTTDCPAQGNRNYIPWTDLYARNFTDQNGEFEIELTMGHVRTYFDSEFRIPHSLTLPARLSHTPKIPPKIETTYFTFGGFDWNLALYPFGSKDAQGGTNGVSLYLNRCTGFDHQCRVRYSIVIGNGDHRIDSGLVDDVSDSDGKSYGWHPRARYIDLLYKGAIRVHLEMILATTLSEVNATISSGPVGANLATSLALISSATHCYDRDKQAWIVKTDCQAEFLRLNMIFKDVHNIPPNHLRYVSWTAYILRYSTKGIIEPIPLPGAPFSHYYSQEQQDEGMIIETEVGVQELRELSCPYVTNGQIKLQIEWEESYLLFQATYHKYDDVCRLHNHQMRREISALQKENFSLERQLFSYQKSIAYAHSRGTYPDDLRSLEGRPVEDEEEDRYYNEARVYTLSERSISTDTEYV